MIQTQKQSSLDIKYLHSTFCQRLLLRLSILLRCLQRHATVINKTLINMKLLAKLKSMNISRMKFLITNISCLRAGWVFHSIKVLLPRYKNTTTTKQQQTHKIFWKHIWRHFSRSIGIIVTSHPFSVNCKNTERYAVNIASQWNDVLMLVQKLELITDSGWQKIKFDL